MIVLFYVIFINVFIFISRFALNYDAKTIFQLMSKWIYYIEKYLFCTKIYEKDKSSYIHKNKRNLLIMNHQTMLDFKIVTSHLYDKGIKRVIYVMFNLYDGVPFAKEVIDKEHILTYPSAEYEKTEANIRRRMAELVADGEPFTVVIFAEGELLNRLKMRRSHKYCNRLEIERFNNVLCPKYKGVSLLLEYPFDNIYDGTMYIPKKFHNVDFAGSPSAIFKDNSFSHVYMHINNVTKMMRDTKYEPKGDFGKTKDRIEKILIDLFRKKDATIERYKADYYRIYYQNNIDNKQTLLFFSNVLMILWVYLLFKGKYMMTIAAFISMITARMYWNEFRPSANERIFSHANWLANAGLFALTYIYGTEQTRKFNVYGAICYGISQLFKKIHNNNSTFNIFFYMLLHQFTFISALML